MTQKKEAAERLERPHPQDVAHGYKAEPTMDELWGALSAAYAALDAAEAEKRAAVAAAYEKAMDRMRQAAATEDDLGHTVNAALFDTAVALIRALSDTDALAEYVAKERAEAYRQGWTFAYGQWEHTASVPDPDYTPAAVRQETNDD
jgi:hypothetical protein